MKEVNNTIKEDDVSSLRLIPTKGSSTQFYDLVFSDEPEEMKQIERTTLMILDGLEKIKPDFVITVGQFIEAQAPETIFSPDYPHVGLKIHVALDPESSTYGELLLNIAELCLTEDPDGKSTSFKVMSYATHKGIKYKDPHQARKIVTLYPNYRAGEKTNTEETTRLVKRLRLIMQKNTQSIGYSIHNEHQAGKSIFLRAGAFTNKGVIFEHVSKTAPFLEQVQYNLDSPETDCKLFIQQVSEAIEAGVL